MSQFVLPSPLSFHLLRVLALIFRMDLSTAAVPMNFASYLMDLEQSDADSDDDSDDNDSDDSDDDSDDDDSDGSDDDDESDDGSDDNDSDGEAGGGGLN